MHVWINFEPDDPDGQKFLKIKELLGVKSRPEVFRHMIRVYDVEGIAKAFKAKHLPMPRKGKGKKRI